MATTAVAAPPRVAMVVPPLAHVDACVADLRATPDDGAELVDQVHYREIARVLASRDGWHYLHTEDHYYGWVRADAVQVLPGDGGLVVGRPVAPVYEATDRSARIVGHLPAGTPLPPHDHPPAAAGWARVRSTHLEATSGTPAAYVSLEDATDLSTVPHRPPTAEDLLATAEGFLGAPYLWGGTTALGMDCSGFVQQVYRLNGIRLDRDADQQAMEGRGVDVPAAGDLIFFGADRITHVALATGEHTFIHAPQAGAKVEHGRLPAAGRTVRRVRRYLE